MKLGAGIFTLVCSVLAGVANAQTPTSAAGAAPVETAVNAQALATATTLLAQAREAHGGDAWALVQRLAMSADATSSAMGPFTYQTKLILGSAAAEVATITVGPYRFAWGFDGQQGWNQDPTGAVELLQKADEIALRRTAVFGDSYGYLFAQTLKFERHYVGQRRVQLTGTSASHGAPSSALYDVVRVTPVGGAAVELLLNPQTHRVEGQVGTVGDPVQRQQFSDFRTVDGVLLPFVIESFDAATGKALDRTNVKSYQINAEISAADLAIPSPSQPTKSRAGNAGVL